MKNEFQRGATSGGDGVHILTGPIYVEGAEPGDMIAVEILDLSLRPNPQGQTYGSNAAAWWGYQARVPKADGSAFVYDSENAEDNDEIITIYEMIEEDGDAYAIPLYQYVWPSIIDPNGTERNSIAYPGTCVPHSPHGTTESVSSSVSDMGWARKANTTIQYYDDVFRAKIPISMHIGCMGLAPESHSYVDSIPPLPTGGNLDNKRIGVGTTMYYPVEVAGGLLSKFWKPASFCVCCIVQSI